MEPLLTQGTTWGVALFLCIELFLMGATFAPMGALLPELFPTHVRHTGASAAYNLGGIVGASAAPFFAQKLVAMGSDERRVGKEGVSTCRCGGQRDHKKKKT